MTNSPSFNTYGNSEPNLLDEAQGPELEPIESSMRVSNLTEGLGVPEAGIRLSVDTDCNEERAAKAGQRIVSIFAFLLEDSEGKHF